MPADPSAQCPVISLLLSYCGTAADQVQVQKDQPKLSAKVGADTLTGINTICKAIAQLAAPSLLGSSPDAVAQVRALLRHCRAGLLHSECSACVCGGVDSGCVTCLPARHPLPSLQGVAYLSAAAESQLAGYRDQEVEILTRVAVWHGVPISTCLRAARRWTPVLQPWKRVSSRPPVKPHS